MAGNLFFGMFYIAISTFSRLYLFYEGTFPVLLLILYYSSDLRILALFFAAGRGVARRKNVKAKMRVTAGSEQKHGVLTRGDWRRDPNTRSALTNL